MPTSAPVLDHLYARTVFVTAANRKSEKPEESETIRGEPRRTAVNPDAPRPGVNFRVASVHDSYFFSGTGFSLCFFDLARLFEPASWAAVPALAPEVCAR